MKSIAILVLSLFALSAQAQNVVESAGYNVVSSQCVTSTAIPTPCAYESTSLTISLFDDGTAVLDKAGDINEIIFMGTDSNASGFEVLNVTPDLKRLYYSNTKELFAAPDASSDTFVNDRISVNIEFNQINSQDATLVESTSFVNNQAEIQVVTYTVKLKKK